MIEQPQDLRHFLERADLKNYNLKLLPTLSGNRRPLKHILSCDKFKTVLVLIGPEGDFTPQEVNLAKKAGFIPASLGNLLLRVDTAAIAVVSFLKLRLECR